MKMSNQRSRYFVFTGNKNKDMPGDVFCFGSYGKKNIHPLPSVTRVIGLEMGPPRSGVGRSQARKGSGIDFLVRTGHLQRARDNGILLGNEIRNGKEVWLSNFRHTAFYFII